MIEDVKNMYKLASAGPGPDPPFIWLAVKGHHELRWIDKAPRDGQRGMEWAGARFKWESWKAASDSLRLCKNFLWRPINLFNIFIMSETVFRMGEVKFEHFNWRSRILNSYQEQCRGGWRPRRRNAEWAWFLFWAPHRWASSSRRAWRREVPTCYEGYDRARRRRNEGAGPIGVGRFH